MVPLADLSPDLALPGQGRAGDLAAQLQEQQIIIPYVTNRSVREARFMENFHYSNQLLAQLSSGAFLTVSDQNKVNTMTIGWGTMGFIWNKPVIMVAVRPSRYSYEFIEKNGNFTVSVPLSASLKKELAGAGTKSGRDIDKFEVFSLKAKPGLKVPVPVIEQCDLFYEGKVVYKQAMNPEHLDESINNAYYKQGDYHVLYYGEILASYLKDW
jgi:flavin reductase (DIM6/NTAB) family NADH-FMN oxidoreductase RutF